MPRGVSVETKALIAQVNSILAQYQHPLTLRQVFYRLVSALVIPNTENAYKGLSKKLARARERGDVDDERIVDLVRRPLKRAAWADLAAFAEAVLASYHRDPWQRQWAHVEVWCEKDALTSVLEPITKAHDVLLFPCRGYQSRSSLVRAAARLSEADTEGCDVYVVYLGDFDPSGEDMVRDLCRRLVGEECRPHLEKLALTPEQIAEHDLPPMPTKTADPRSAAHVARHGDVAVELDALPPDVLQDLVEGRLDELCDKSAFEEAEAQEATDLARLRDLLAPLLGDQQDPPA